MLPFTKTGSGTDVLLFLHFFGGSRREWREVIERLSLHSCCVAADMPGFGEAAHLTGYTVAEMASAVCSLIEHFAPAPVMLVGHSMSGKVGMVVAANPPANLRRLVLVAPSPLLPEPMTEDDRETMTIANTSEERIKSFVQGGAYKDLSDEDFAIAAEDVRRANPAAWIAWPQQGAREDWSERIRNLGVPTDLIAGEHDKAIPLAFQREHTQPLVERTGGTVTIIEEVAHLLPYEAVPELVVALEESLSRWWR